MKALAFAIVLGCAAIASAQPAVQLRGRVVDKTTQQPVVGATIIVANEWLATDDDGRFAITLAPGRYTIKVEAGWLVPKEQAVALTGDSDVVIEVEPAKEARGEHIEVQDVAPTPPGVTQVEAKVAQAIIGDAGKIVHFLGPVARPQAGSSEVVVWGAAPRDTRVFVDGVPVPALYHIGGYRAAVGNDLVGSIRLSPAAFGPDRGRAIGGVIDIALAEPDKAPQVRAQADLLDGSLAGRAMLGGITIAAAVRNSWLDRAIDLVKDPQELAPNAPLPRWLDGQILARAPVSDTVVATAWVLGAIDQLDRTLASDDPATQTDQAVDQRTLRAQITLRREHADGDDSATLWIGRDRTSDDLQVGLIPATQRAAYWVGGARAVQHTRLGAPATLALGLDLDGESAEHRRTGSLTIPAREGDLHIFGQPPGDDVNADEWTATTLDIAGYAALDLRAGPVTATLGGRADGWLLGASRLTPRVGTTPGIASQQMLLSGDPRASVEVRVADETIVRVEGGRYHQARASSDVSAVFGTPGLGLEHAWHVIAGAQWRRTPFTVEGAAYARWLENLVARDLAVTPLFAQALTQGGIGRVYGIQLTARANAWRGLTGWLTYSLSRSTRKDADSQAERLFDHDQTHGLIAAAAYEAGGWTLGTRIRVATGEPRTPVIGSFFDSRSGRFQPIRGDHNGVRLPTFFAADLRVERRLDLGVVRGAVYADLQNLSNRANAEEIIYSADFMEQSYLTGLPFLAIVGVRIER